MYRHHHWPAHGVENETAKRQTSGLAGLVVILLLLVGGLFLVRQLRETSVIQDCLMTGRSNCDVLLSRQR